MDADDFSPKMKTEKGDNKELPEERPEGTEEKPKGQLVNHPEE